jgi:hypothetical protein
MSGKKTMGGFLKMKLDNISSSRQTKAQRTDGDIELNPHCSSRFPAAAMDSLMEDTAFGGEAIFPPLLLDMHKSASSRAKEEVLQSGDHDQIVFTVSMQEL